MRISKNLIGLAAVGILAAGCGSSSSDDSAGSSGSSGSAGQAPSEEAKAPEPGADLAVPVTGPQPDVLASSSDPKLKVTPKPANGASFTEKVEHKLQEDLLGRLKVPGKTSANCPDGVTQKASAVSICNVTYEGATVPYEIEISEKYKPGSFVTFYNSTPKKGLLVAKNAYDRLWTSHKGRTDISKLSCDELPAAKAVDEETETGFHCQYWGKHGGEDGTGGFVKLGIKVNRHNVDFFEVR
ncbi:hypothetical protein PV689_24790 [Streptomyces sp. ATCC51928]|uniref:Lipoprotein n=1 Tax=Streptomyces caviscabies TaxID=90079 RepID=A0ABW2MGX0_9ACTN|nr:MULTISPECIES: hypothetical protein [unclassified Streptomyces]MDX3505146.1 hypothetical protein [Streptomyces sp. ATCC51928]MDX5524662.1 hypothetical protein [Streptomyces sp. DE06-01C]